MNDCVLYPDAFGLVYSECFFDSFGITQANITNAPSIEDLLKNEEVFFLKWIKSIHQQIPQVRPSHFNNIFLHGGQHRIGFLHCKLIHNSFPQLSWYDINEIFCVIIEQLHFLLTDHDNPWTIGKHVVVPIVINQVDIRLSGFINFQD